MERIHPWTDSLAIMTETGKKHNFEIEHGGDVVWDGRIAVE
jgi:hypothetical protein